MIDPNRHTDKSMVYMYGLSDMWTDLFEDTNIVESVLKANTISLAEVYSYFLQRSSGISLADIQEKYQTRIKLLLLSEEDLVDSTDLTTFKLNNNEASAKNLSNRPLLPTEVLTDELDFEIEDGILKLNRDITEYRFPQRVTSEGKWQFAIWMTDVVINDKWIDNSFGKLVGFSEEDTISNYKGFLEGVYYLYANGPNVHFIERGVNLAMGMPYARETEKILSIVKDVDTGNYHVFTGTQTYEIPFGFNPNLTEGNYLTKGEVITSWVEVNDWYTKGDWWYEIYLPPEVLVGISPTDLGKARPGTTADGMMQTFLKHQMFQVLVTQPNSDPEAFNTAVRLVMYSKPAYTFPVFVWKVPIEDEIIDMQDDLTYYLQAGLQDTCVSAPSVRDMDRGMDGNPFNRGTNWYNRCQGSVYAAGLLGYGDVPNNGGWYPEFESLEPRYEKYLAVGIRNRGDKVSPTTRGTAIRGWRGVSEEDNFSMTWEISGDQCSPAIEGTYSFRDKDYTPLYLMTDTELTSKLAIISPEITISESHYVVTDLNLQDLYYSIMVRGSFTDIDTLDANGFLFKYTEGGLDPKFSTFANQSYVPSVEDLPTSDGVLFFAKVSRNTWGAYWVHSSIVREPTILPIEDIDWTWAVESYDYNDLGEDRDIGTRVVMPGLTDIRLEDSIIHSSEALILAGDTFIKDWSVSDDILTLPMALGSIGTIVSLPSTGMSTIWDTPPYVGPHYLLSETVTYREELLVEVDGVITFAYVVADDRLYTVAGDIRVQYMYRDNTLPDDESFPIGSLNISISEDSDILLFVGSTYLPEHSYYRSGTDIVLPLTADGPVVVRYYTPNTKDLLSFINRGTVARNGARFLLDRSSETGEYTDSTGYTSTITRDGVYGTEPLRINRRLR